MQRKPYISDLTEVEWQIIRRYLPNAKPGGRPRKHRLRELVNAMFYLTRSGCAWRLLPQEFPPWKTGYHYFRRWRLDGVWHRLHTALREQLRQSVGRQRPPSAGILDSQSVKTTRVGGPRGFDGGKKVNGRKRHLLVDTQGWVIEALVHPADVHDRDGAPRLLGDATLNARHPRLAHLGVDRGYAGRAARWIEETLGWRVEVVKHGWTGGKGVWVPPGGTPPTIPSGFHVLPRRWVVARTFAWLGFSRRLSKDYERVPETSEAFIFIAMIRIMLRRLARQK